MPTLPTYFDDFIKAIRLQDDLKTKLQEAHAELSDRLEHAEDLKAIFVATFLQGSYRRSTITDPEQGDLADVDVVLVTGIDEQIYPQPETAMVLFEPFLNRHYRGLWEPQDRSFGITLDALKMDLVPTSAPSEVVREMLAWRSVRSQLGLEDDPAWRLRRAWAPPELRATIGGWQAAMDREGQAQAAVARAGAGWRNEPLRIPDRTRKCWEPTHPLAQIDWTSEKNARCNGHYLAVVRALKWWRRRHPAPKYPKGYPLEHLVGDACPDGITSIAEGVKSTLEELDRKWADIARQKQQPVLWDHGVQQNVLGRVSPADFAAFHALVSPAAKIARRAWELEDIYEGVAEWQRLFGSRFPDAPDRGPNGRGPEGPKGGFTPRTEQTLVGGGRFA